jgi:hypothetical protein
LPELLQFTSENVAFLPKISTKTQGLELHFAHQLAACLASSRAEARHAAENLLKTCAQFGVLSSASVLSGVEKLLPAQQRGVRPIVLDAFAQESSSVTEAEKSVAREVVTSLRGSRSIHDHESVKSPAKKAIYQGLKTQSAETIANEKLSRGNMEAVDFPRHPLLHPSNNNNKAMGKVERISSRKRESWPEFPEVPSGKDYLMLRKGWACYLPPNSVSLLLPQAGFSKHDDAVSGIEILSEAVKAEKTDLNVTVTVDFLDFIFKWITIVLCTRESTTGMHAILSLVLDLFQVLQTREYILADSEATILLPHLLEKGSAAKVYDLDA